MDNSVTFNNGQQMQVNTNLKKLFPGGNVEKELKSYNYTNGTGAIKTIVAGTVMGVVKATGKVLPMKSDAVDGSQVPCGVLARDYTVDIGATISVAVGIRGDVRSDMLVFEKAGDALTTVQGERRLGEILEDRLVLRSVSNNTAFDNVIV